MLKSLTALILIAASPIADSAHPAALVGDYDGGQMEMAVGLSLKADGRFEYGLSYGALDEQAMGTWRADGRAVLLISDPVTPSRFSLAAQKPATPGTVRITLVAPGIDGQYFDAHLRLADGTAIDQQLGEGATSIPFDPRNPPVGITLSFDLFGVASDPVPIDPAKGYAFDFRFAQNDLGKVDFRSTPLRREGADLLFERHGRSIRFRRLTP